MKEARYYHPLENNTVACELCPHACKIQDEKCGICLARINKGGKLYSATYNKICSMVMDPIEKKPLYHFYPTSNILSLGSWGCNFKCSFCQNWEISQQEVPTQEIPPEVAINTAIEHKSIGIAYTYNEPYINFEYVLECAKLARENGLKNVMVSNGFYNPDPLQELLKYIDAFNIDIKAFTGEFYKDICKGSLEAVLRSAKEISKHAHLEVTTLLIPGRNDDDAELEKLSEWIAQNCGEHTPAHLSAYFPRYKLQASPTTPRMLLRAREIFKQQLQHVYIGNVASSFEQNSYCHNCDNKLVTRECYNTEICGLDKAGKCNKCQADNNFFC